jgi:type I restriction enzyme S subunit
MNRELPKGWKVERIRNVAELHRGISYSKEDAMGVPAKTHLPILRATNINGDLNYDDLVYVPKELIKKEQYVKKDDVVFAMSSGSKHLVGKSAIAKKDFNGSIGAFCALLRINESVNKRYISFVFQGNSYRKLISEIAKGTNINNLKREHILDFEFPLPPLPEQHRIVAKIEELFSDLDKGIESLKTAQQQLRTYRKSVLKWAFEGKLTHEWRLKNHFPENYQDELEQQIEKFNSLKDGQDIPRRLPPIDFEGLYDLPQNWKWIEAHKICQSVRDGTHDTPKYVEDGVPLVTSKNLVNGEIDFSNVELIAEKDYREIVKRSGVDNGDILFAMIGTIGNPVIINLQRRFGIKNVGLFKVNEKFVSSKYLAYWLSSSTCEKILKEKDLIKGTTQKFIALGGLRVLPVPFPSLQEQHHIIQEIESRLSVCDKLEEIIAASVRQSESLRQSILKKAFEGRLV